MDKLREARVKVGLTQAELAEKIHVTRAIVAHWEQGNSSPTEDQKQKLARVLDIENGGEDAGGLAAWLTKERHNKGWSVPELADRAGLTSASLYRIERGITRNIREATRRQLESALGVEMPTDTKEEIAKDASIAGLGKLEDFDPHSGADWPDGPGVYVLYDVSDRPIYVGEGFSVRRRMKDHEEKFWFKRPIVESASWIRVADDKLRAQIEKLLIKFLKSNAVLNKQLVER